jgi:hypothetical protein
MTTWRAAIDGASAKKKSSEREADGSRQKAEKEKATRRWLFLELLGGASRSRTGLHGFAGRCITALLSRQKRTVRCLGRRKLLALTTTDRFLRWPCGPPNKRGSAASPRIWSGRRVSNSRPQPWQGCALPTELLPHIYCFTTLYCRHFVSQFCKTPHPESGAGDESRTRDLNLGKVALYQLSYSRVFAALLPSPLIDCLSSAIPCYLHRICFVCCLSCSGEVRLCITR